MSSSFVISWYSDVYILPINCDLTCILTTNLMLIVDAGMMMTSTMLPPWLGWTWTRRAPEYWPPTPNWWERRSARVKTKPFFSQGCYIDGYWKWVNSPQSGTSFSRCTVLHILSVLCILSLQNHPEQQWWNQNLLVFFWRTCCFCIHSVITKDSFDSFLQCCRLSFSCLASV